MMCHALMPMRWVESVEIIDVLDRLETDTIGRSLGNGVSAMAVLGTGLTPLMYVLYIPRSGIFSTVPLQQVEFLRLWLLAQMDAYEYSEKGAGWFFWSAKIQVIYSLKFNY